MIKKIEQDETKIIDTLSKEDIASVIDVIVNNYEDWYEDASQWRDTIALIDRCIYLDITAKPKSNDPDMRLMPQVYSQKQTMVASLWKDLFSSYSKMFNCHGMFQTDDLNAPRQKELIIQSLEDANAKKHLRVSLDDFVRTGEIVMFTGWVTKTKKRREKQSQPVEAQDDQTGQTYTIDKKETYGITNVTVYDGPEATRIDPLKIVFDKDQADSVEDCPFIVHDYIESYKLLDDTTYDIDKEVSQYLLDKLKGAPDEDDDTTDPNKNNQTSTDSKVEMMEYWGDLILPTGDVLRDIVCVVIDKTYIIRLEYNDALQNPFVIYRHNPDPATGRATPPLAVSVPLNEINSAIMASQLKALKLIINKPVLAPEGMFESEQIIIRENGVIKYNDKAGVKPEFLDFKDALVGTEVIQHLTDVMESATGIFRNMSGAGALQARSATETNAVIGGQGTRMGMYVEDIGNFFSTVLVEKVANLLANFKDQIDTVRVTNQEGVVEYVPVPANLTIGNYRYRYANNSAQAEVVQQINTIFDYLMKIGDRATCVDYNKLLTMAFNKLNIVEAESFMKVDPINQALANVPPELQDQIKGQLATEVPMLLQQMQMMGNNQAQGAGNVTQQNSAGPSANQSGPSGRPPIIPSVQNNGPIQGVPNN